MLVYDCDTIKKMRFSSKKIRFSSKKTKCKEAIYEQSFLYGAAATLYRAEI